MVAHELFRRYPRKSEGDLTELKSLLVSRPTLARIARDLGLGEALLLSKNEESTGGRTRPSILADAFEALLGALYLDGGYEVVRRIVVEVLISELPVVSRNPALGNYKSKLLEYVQKQKNGRLVYRTTDERGPDHDKTFIVQVLLDERVLGEGRGDSKKQAQQEAAHAALETLGVVDRNGLTAEVDEGDGEQ